jgi:predicted molibdopterin-dependent oxidoreductase YjgC
MGVNDQWICDKGRFAYTYVSSPDRLKTPLVRKDGELVPATWSEALQTVADRVQAIKQKRGADAIGAIGSAKLSNESNYLLQRLFRQIVGTNNIDHRDGGAVAALPGGMPALAAVMKPQYGPKPTVDTVVLFGIDPSEELPILDLHLKRAVRRGGVKLIIAHPRRIELTRYEGPFLGYTPGSEVTLLNALTGYAVAAVETPPKDAGKVANVTDKELRERCGVDPKTAKAAAELLAGSEHALILYGPMVARGEAGAAVRDALSNLALATGQYARLAFLGLEANSLGARDMGVLPDTLPGYAALDDADARGRLERLWGGALPTKAGKRYAEMLDAAGAGIQALYIMGADPASERADWAAALDKLDLLVVQDLFLTATAAKADVVLPALGWGEVDGTFTNLECRVQRAPRAVRDPQSKAAPDWMILDHLANRLGVNWPFADERAITKEIGQAVPFYARATWDALGDQGLQVDASAVRPQPGFVSVTQPDVPAVAEDALRLVAGTVLYDAGTLFAQTAQMQAMAFGASAALNPEDAARLGIAAGDTLVVGGAIELTAKLDPAVLPGTVWIPEGVAGAPVGLFAGGPAGSATTVGPKAEMVAA